MRFIVDQQLPPALIGWLTAHGHEAEHVRDLGLKEAPDAEIWAHAKEAAAIILTKDEDVAARRARAQQGPAVVWRRFGNATRAALFGRLEDAWADIEAALASGAPVVEVR
jgi:predicted nuclease of predicted toxin-antitoxin system